MKISCKALLAVVLVLLVFSVAWAAEKTWQSQEGEFKGKTITVLITDPHTAVVEAWKPEWEALTGAKVEIIVVPYASLFDKMMTDFITGTGAYDLICWPSTWAGDVMGGGWVIPLDDYMKEYGYPGWDDVMPAIKVVVSWANKVYAFPYDGDCHMFYYRKDALENPDYQAQFEEKYGYRYNVPPKTWEEVMDIAEFFNGWDWDNDGETEYGFAFIAKRKTQAMWSYLDFVMQYAAQPGVAPFFDPDTMDPLVANPGWIEAMKMIQKATQFAPPGLLSYGYSELRQAFVSGNSAMAIDWGDIGIMEQSPEEYGSKVKGLLGYGPLPGAKKTYDFKEGKWVEGYNQVNFLNFGGWVFSISKYSKNPLAAYKFATYFTAPERSILDVCGIHGYTGANPWRLSHFEDLDKWVEGGWSKESAEKYLNTIRTILSDPKAVTDLRIPGAAEYYDYLDLHLAEVLSGQTEAEAACKAIYEDWVKITENYGKEAQRKLYRESLGLD
ncbi:MAG: multiple sugar transport system substrate-binding protein [Candidatus Atribacteria bacterium]|uniref:Extracellular solute-binding protein n=1 Tax=Thermatribacter velox TaxID=3039681 RepID=A0ABZ2YFV5_9BACT|nr:multiple sugar transport system substrate-binding protein [Candidatus Atribacteria bacterium]